MTDVAVQSVSTPLDSRRASVVFREIDVSIVTYEAPPDCLANRMLARAAAYRQSVHRIVRRLG